MSLQYLVQLENIVVEKKDDSWVTMWTVAQNCERHELRRRLIAHKGQFEVNNFKLFARDDI